MPAKDNGVTLVPIASPLHDPRSTARVLAAYRRWLGAVVDREAPYTTAAEEVEHSVLGESAALVGLVLTGGTERIIGAVAALGRPLIVLAHDSMNSFPAALEAMASIPGQRVKMLLGRGTKQMTEVRAFVEGARVLSRIGRYKIGLVGGPSAWLTYSLPETDALAARLGIGVVDIPMDEFRKTYESAPVQRVDASQRGVRERRVPAADLVKSGKIYGALKLITEKQGLSAVSPRCFDFIKDFGATGCLALSRLNDEGVVAGCEGDIPSTVAMIVLAEVSGQPAFMGNPSFIEGRRLVIAHCTVASRLTTDVQYRTHFESGIGLALAGEFRSRARVTVARFARGYGLLRAGAGTVVKGAPWSNDLCRTQVEIRMDGDADIFWKKPIGNHLVMTYGDHVGTLRSLSSIAGVEFEAI